MQQSEGLTHTTTWMSLDNTLLRDTGREASHGPPARPHLIPYAVSRTDESIETGERLVFAQGGGGGHVEKPQWV